MLENLNNSIKYIYLAKCLYDCIEDRDIQAIKKLLQENDANPNITIPDRGITPFHFAIGSWDENVAEEITKLFLGYGGDPNVRADGNLTPVHVAAAWGRLNVLNLLLKCGGDPAFKDEDGKTSVDFARRENHLNIVKYLENFIKDLNYETKLDNINYDLTLNKIIINNGAIIAEYETTNTENKIFNLDDLPKNITNDYVKNWCLKHAAVQDDKNILINSNFEVNKTVDKNLSITKTEDNLIDSSSEESIPKCYSRESGIQTIHSSSSENNLDKSMEEIIETSFAEYMTCRSANEFEKNIVDSLITADLSEQKNSEVWNITEDESLLFEHNIPCQITAAGDKNHLINIEEEYKYTDNEEKIVLIEKRILVNPKIDDNKSIISNSSKISSLPSVINYDTDTLRQELTNLGEQPGPITKTTKRVYLKRLKKLQKYSLLEPPVNKKENRVYSVELEKTLRDPNWTKDLTCYKALESVIVNQFSKPEPSKRWREGCTKASFTYLLLDPRVTSNLPIKSSELTPEEIWKTFLSAIFYVGKGKRSRPYCHLYEAVNFWKNGQKSHGANKKINYILDIWGANFGVVCLHIFQNVIPVEAYTREAAMINALKLQNLCNSKLGDFYGICATWPERKKRLLGVYLLYRAMLIFLNEGERQLMPDDIGK